MGLLEVHMNKKEILEIRKRLKQLSIGIDPETGIKYPEDTLLNERHNKELFKGIITLLDEILDYRLVSSDQRRKKPFTITAEQIQLLKKSEEPVSISAFVYSLNSISQSKDMKKLKSSDITSWLANQGYLSEVLYYNGCYCRELTDKSKDIGLSVIKKKNQDGNEYNVIMYNSESQQFIIDHLYEILDCI